MKIIGQFFISRSEDTPTGFLEWLQTKIIVNIHQDGYRFLVSSDNTNSKKVAVRIKQHTALRPLAFWRIEYSKKDLDNAEYLRLWSGSYIADLAFPAHAEILEVAPNSALKSPRDFGAIRPFGSVVAVNESLMRIINSHNPKGVVWAEVAPRNGKSHHKRIWRLMSSIILPKCPVPLVHSSGEPFMGDYTKGCAFQNPYREVELAYTAQSLSCFGDFDIALTKEKTGNYSGGCFQSLIISQNFRQILLKENIKAAKFTPVRVLQPQDAVIRDPLEFLASESR